MIIQICVGSSCHLRGSEEIVTLFTEAIERYKLGSEVTLVGNFCAAKCNRIGVTVTLDDVIHTGVTPDTFNKFFEENVLKPFGKVE